jgi:hypothetical protein
LDAPAYSRSGIPVAIRLIDFSESYALTFSS